MDIDDWDAIGGCRGGERLCRKRACRDDRGDGISLGALHLLLLVANVKIYRMASTDCQKLIQHPTSLLGLSETSAQRWTMSAPDGEADVTLPVADRFQFLFSAMVCPSIENPPPVHGQ